MPADDVAASGDGDSSVAAAVLHQANHLIELGTRRVHIFRCGNCLAPVLMAAGVPYAYCPVCSQARITVPDDGGSAPRRALLRGWRRQKTALNGDVS